MRALQIAGAGLAVVMGVLMGIGTYNHTAFIVWVALFVVGIVVFLLARRADEQARRRRLDEDFRRRQASGRDVAS